MNINNESAGHQRSLRNNLGATRAAIVALVAVLVTVGLATPAQAAVNFWASVIVGQGVSYVNVRSAPSTTSTILRTIASGQRVGLDCYVTGQAVTGPYGPPRSGTASIAALEAATSLIAIWKQEATQR